MTIRWDAKLSVGNDAIDEDHRRLIELINEYESAVAQKNIKILDHAFQGLEDYTQEHFEREERIMEAVHYPNRRSHGEAHRALLQSVQDKHAQIRMHQHIDIDELSKFLRSWLIDHVLKEDMKIKEYLVGGRHDFGR